MIEIHVDLRFTVHDELVDDAVQFVRAQARNAVAGYHTGVEPHELEITTQDRSVVVRSVGDDLSAMSRPVTPGEDAPA